MSDPTKKAAPGPEDEDIDELPSESPPPPRTGISLQDEIAALTSLDDVLEDEPDHGKP
ncbi:MAG TPA: hypothetical protein VFI08_01630 [Spirochaetia bacterium]|nr:hypothetical protein [Spirochaetia bacterium]